MRTPKQLMGARSRKNGRDWEREVQKRYETEGWIVSRWAKKPVWNETKGSYELQDAKSNRFRLQTCGFPDYVAMSQVNHSLVQILFIECKTKPYLDPEERKMKSYYEELGYKFIVEAKESVRSKQISPFVIKSELKGKALERLKERLIKTNSKYPSKPIMRLE